MGNFNPHSPLYYLRLSKILYWNRLRLVFIGPELGYVFACYASACWLIRHSRSVQLSNCLTGNAAANCKQSLSREAQDSLLEINRYVSL